MTRRAKLATSQISHYRLIEKLGGGGMRVPFRCARFAVGFMICLQVAVCFGHAQDGPLRAKIAPSTPTMFVGGPAVQFSATVSFIQGSGKTGGSHSIQGTWSSSNASVVSVTPGGLATAVKPGTAVISLLGPARDSTVATVISPPVFVSPLGLDTNAGTCAKPLLTIPAAITLAASLGRSVAVMQGPYNQPSTIALANGVSLLGGFASNCSQTGSVPQIVVAQPTAISAVGITTPTTLDMLNIQGANNLTPGGSAYGVLVLNSTGLNIRRSTITAGSGASGANGTAGAAGGSGGNGGSATGATQGGAGSSPAGATGGQGGAGPACIAPGNGGDSGLQIVGGGIGALGGMGGTTGVCHLTSSGSAGSAPGVTFGGGLGGSGVNGSAAATLGSFDASGNYLPPAGNDGTAGLPGGGGGGGGSGGGDAHGSVSSACLMCGSCAFGGGGGGGGGGGKGGGLGQGGAGGGSSFAIVSLASSVSVDTTTQLITGNGGNGGKGGNGAKGGSGGQGGSGASGQVDANTCSTGNGGAGANGSTGGGGGDGGSGSGGTGGASVCIAYSGTAPSTTTISCTHGNGGLGGAGGSNGALGTAPPGTKGVTGAVQAVP